MAQKLQATLFIWHALTPVHSGTGQAGAAAIDLPIARETATGFPILPASSVKGVLRSAQTDGEADLLFGTQGAAGQLTFTDARLLALPVRSYRGTFAYVTCPLVIRRLARDLAALGCEIELPELPGQLADNCVHVAGDALIYRGEAQQSAVLFEDIDLAAVECPKAKELARQLSELAGLAELASRLAVVSDNVFAYFCETATEVSAHIKLEETTKTVDHGMLWYEETLPAESLLSSFMLRPIGVSSPVSDGQVLQVGGKATVGRGLLQLKLGGQI